MASDPLLVVGPSWVGDMVMAQSLFMQLRHQQPDQPIDVLAPGWCKGILERMPEVREAVELPSQHGQFDLGMRRRLGQALRPRGYGRAVILPRSFKSALPAWFAGIPQRTGYLGEMRYGLINDVRPRHKPTFRHTARRFLYLVEPDSVAADWAIPQPQLRVDSERQQVLLMDHGLDDGSPLVALLPGAEYGPAKQWPPLRFAQLAQALGEQGSRCIVLGSPKEQSLGDAIAAQGGGAVTNLCGRTSLPDAIDLIAACSAAVSNDSGLMHVAAAVGVSVIGLYGSSSAERTPPLSDRATVLTRNMACQPCFKRHCPYGHTACLRHIGAEQVLTALAAEPAPMVK